jgi:hypothetical protein
MEDKDKENSEDRQKLESSSVRVRLCWSRASMDLVRKER